MSSISSAKDSTFICKTSNPRVYRVGTYECELNNYTKTSKALNFLESPEVKDKTTTLSIFGKNVEKIPDGIFENYKNIGEFVMTNVGLLEITETSFKDAFKIENLNLSKNNLTTISSNIFKDMKILNTFDASFNFIEKISSDTFKGLEKLVNIVLDNNKLKIIEKGAFNNLNIEELQLTQNELVQFDFENLQAMIVYLNDNLLTHLTVTGNVSILIAMRNQISTIDIQTTILETLRLENNSFTDINSIKNGKSLISLDLSHNNIGNPSLRNLDELMELILIDTKLCCLTNETFAGLTNLKTLQIFKNDLKIESLEIFKPLVNLTTLAVDKNSFADWNFEKLKLVIPKINYLNLATNGQLKNNKFRSL